MYQQHQHLNDNTANGSTTTIVGTAGASNLSTNWSQPLYKKSLSCPHCTPRCPHGYPIETSPTVTWTYPNITYPNIYCNTTQGTNTATGLADAVGKASI